MDTGESAQRVRDAYDQVAREYGNTFADELARKPFDRALLQRFSRLIRPGGTVWDVGCGPAHVGAYVGSCNVTVCAIDASPAMVREARRRNPTMRIEEGDILHLSAHDGTWAGIAAFYCVIHLRREKVPDALREFYRVLEPGGWLVLAVHAGEGEVHVEEFLGRPVTLSATLFTRQDIVNAIQAAGFRVEDALQRSPYSFEGQTMRVYVLARKPTLA